MHAQSQSHVQLFVTPLTVAYQALLSMEFSRQEYWSGSPFPPSVDLLDPEIEPMSLVSPALAGGFLATEPPVGSPYPSASQRKRDLVACAHVKK